jgi:HEAT repeat protein
LKIEVHINESFEELCDLLKSSNKKQRHQAIFRLCTSYPSQSAVLILNMVRGRDKDDRSQARRWLLRRGGEEATMALLPYLYDEELEVRCLVAGMIYALRDKQIALPLLFECLQDDAWQVRRIAAERLGTGRWEDMQIVEKLVPCLQDPELWVRLAAAGSLGKLGNTRGVETLVINLQNPELQVRINVADALGNIADERAVKALLTCLQDHEAGVRHTAVRSLRKVGDSRIIPVVLPYLQDPSWEVQIGIVEILEAWGDAQVVEPLLACLSSEKKWPTRKWICYALGKLGDERAIDPLIKCLHDEESQIQAFLAPVESVYQAGSQVRCAAAWALGKLGNLRAIEPLRACLSDEDKEVQSVAARALERLSNE